MLLIGLDNITFKLKSTTTCIPHKKDKMITSFQPDSIQQSKQYLLALLRSFYRTAIWFQKFEITISQENIMLILKNSFISWLTYIPCETLACHRLLSGAPPCATREPPQKPAVKSHLSFNHTFPGNTISNIFPFPPE